jgi:hypothetical protein
MTTLSVVAAMIVLPPLFVVPGWLWLRRCGVDPLTALYAGIGPTAAAAAGVVALGQLLPWSVRITCGGGLVLIVLASAWCAVRAPRPLLPARGELAGLAVFACAFVAAACFVSVPSRPGATWENFSIGPGRVDTARWAGQTIDNTLPYRTGQVAFYKQDDQLRGRFSVRWWISDRTPLVGLDFAFTVGALGAHMRPENPEQRRDSSISMQIKDSYAFWLYNLVATLLASAIVLAVFLLARVWKGDARVALAAALVAALMPGLFLNTIFTWPKPATAYFVLVAAALALQRRPALAGGFAALGYLVHPVGLFFVPSLAILLLADSGLRARWRGTIVRFLGTAAVLVVPWQLFTTLKLHAISKLAFWPLGWVTEQRTHPGVALDQAWHAFVGRGFWSNVWTRVESTAGSVLPSHLLIPTIGPAPLRARDLSYPWSYAHGTSLWGMVGLVLFPAVVLHIARRWPQDRLMVAGFVAPFVFLIVLAAGFIDTWSNQSAFALVGLLAVPAGEMLVMMSRAGGRILWLAIAFELLTVAYGTQYRPFNASGATVALFAIAGIGSHVVLLTWLARSTGPRGARSRRDPRALRRFAALRA